MKLSVIIPTFNSAKYIEKALLSICENQYPDLEVLVIDDGSIDDTKIVVQNLISKYPIIKYFYKENGGASSARNLGLEKAMGEYIMFCDADDYYEEHLIDCNISYLKKDVDLLVFGRKDYQNHTLISTSNRHNTVKMFQDGMKYIEKQFSKAFGTLSVCNKIYKLEIIKDHHISFQENLKHSEDVNFNLQYIPYCKTIIENETINYIRISVPGSATNRNIHDFYFLNVESAFYNISIDDKKIKENLCTHYAFVAIYRILNNMEQMDKKMSKQEIKKIMNSFQEEGYTYTQKNGLKNKVFAFLFNHRMVNLLYFAFGSMKKILKG